MIHTTMKFSHSGVLRDNGSNILNLFSIYVINEVKNSMNVIL